MADEDVDYVLAAVAEAVEHSRREFRLEGVAG
jgi:hypothetical protein